MPEDKNQDTRPKPPSLPPEMTDDEATRMQTPDDRTRDMPPVKDTRLIPPPPQQPAPPEKPKRGAPPTSSASGQRAPVPSPAQGVRSRPVNPLAIPIWSIVLM
ncbi:MAG: hypothetical protein K8L97_00495, partial [Anaerolineae bacterium]|nr:hypothetical protein [Anaerolineae bacterium]